MKHKKILVILLLLVVGSVFIFNGITKEIKKFTLEGVELAVEVDGIDQNDFPSMGEYNVSVDCVGVTGTWNYDNWKLELSNMTSNSANCNINFTSAPNMHIKLNDKIIGLSGQIQGTGQIINENGYRYEGKNPNNYVLFNGELWRIIGVFNSETHGKLDNLTKIIRDESIGSFAWDKSETNDWSVASLNTILNTYYYNSQDATGQDACYFYITTLSGNCDFRYTGINGKARGMIQEVIWKLGGCSSENATAEEFYEYERGTTVYSGNSTTATGYIGLMYPSDYGYSVLASSCTRSTSLGSYNSPTCGGQSWLLKYGFEWTMTPNAYTWSHVFYVNSYAILGYMSGTRGGFAVRPVVYLKSNVYIISGDGSITNPYILGI